MLVRARRNQLSDILKSTYKTLHMVLPGEHSRSKPQALGDTFVINYGVLVGITGDFQGKLILSGHNEVFRRIGELMFDSTIDKEMVSSFSCELGNMIAGNLSTVVVEKGIVTDITYPSIINGKAKITGYEQAMQISVHYTQLGEMDIVLLFD